MTIRSVGAAVVVVVALTGCAGGPAMEIPGVTTPVVSDAEQVLRVMAEVHWAMSEKRIYRVMAHVSQYYLDAEGRDYEGLQDHLKTVFKNYKDIKVTRVRPAVSITGSRAHVVETFGTVANPIRPSDRPISTQGKVDVYLEKSGGKWLIVEWGTLR
ncbi:MAG: hypothetical protein GY851_26095 [bacterium]|nr:hypothetical protein [bacterium]